MKERIDDNRLFLSCNDECKLLILLMFIGINMLLYTNKMQLYHEEPRRALIAQEMLFRKNFIVPTVYSEIYLKKPPLHNWLIAALAYPSGVVSNFDARFPSILCIWLLGWSVFRLLHRIDRKVAFRAAVVSVTCYVVLISYGNKAEPDMLLTFLTFLSYYFYIRNPERFSSLILSSVFMSAGILCKGVSPVFFYPGIILYILLYQTRKRERFLRLSFHFILALIPVLGWLWVYQRETSLQPLLNTFFHEGYSRLESSIVKFVVHTVTFPFRAFLALLPWSLLIFFIRWRRIREIKDPVFRSSGLILLCTLAIMTLAPGGRGRYFMPVAPFFAIALAFVIPSNARIHPGIVRFFCFGFTFLLLGSAVYIATLQMYFQSLALLVAGTIVFFFRRRKFSAFDCSLTISLLIFLFYMHCVYAYRAATHIDFLEAAQEIVQITGKDIPFVVDPSADPIKLAFNIERVTGHSVYLYKPEKFSRFICITTRKSCRGCRRIMKLFYSHKIPELFIYRCEKDVTGVPRKIAAPTEPSRKL